MIGDRRQIEARRIVERLETFKRHLIDVILDLEPEDSPIHARALQTRELVLDLMAEYAAVLDYPPPAHYLRDWRTPIAAPAKKKKGRE